MYEIIESNPSDFEVDLMSKFCPVEMISTHYFNYINVSSFAYISAHFQCFVKYLLVILKDFENHLSSFMSTFPLCPLTHYHHASNEVDTMSKFSSIAVNIAVDIRYCSHMLMYYIPF